MKYLFVEDDTKTIHVSTVNQDKDLHIIDDPGETICSHEDNINLYKNNIKNVFIELAELKNSNSSIKICKECVHKLYDN